jgi:nucleoside-diphosphate-sugar epimerase
MTTARTPLHVVVTGVAGFVGSHMVRGLANAGVRVTGTFRHTPPADAVAQASFALIQQDLTRLSALPRCDVLVHTAATSLATQPDHPAPAGDFEQDNVVATERLLDAAAAAGCRRVVLLSSVSVYGHITASEVDETTPLVDPDPYGASKRGAEVLLEQRADAMAGLAVRLPAVVGRHRAATAPSAARARVPSRGAVQQRDTCVDPRRVGDAHVRSRVARRRSRRGRGGRLDHRSGRGRAARARPGRGADHRARHAAEDAIRLVESWRDRSVGLPSRRHRITSRSVRA